MELFADPPDAHLYPEEAGLVVRAVDKRRSEFATVRLCARTALAGLGVAPRPILRGPGGAPVWPGGIVGSMTHCDGYRAAAVARNTAVASVGIDAETHAPLPAGIERLVALPEERRTLDRLTRSHPAVHWDRLLFSAKESTYKTWFPLTGLWLDFGDCVITPDPENGTFDCSLNVPGPVVGGRRIDGFTGRWRTVTRDGAAFVATAITVPAPGIPGPAASDRRAATPSGPAR
ncbi:4'-phosphopantetheinyl transferase family protein [Streptomyces roseoverticillatus]|uniref:4'-phosphopantetheinyl transferase family protein n=1 Tax=Streptomyces roseoverticillatus TaxID=66429 RepID=UPI001F1A79A7|nr:4'-phosphopantetheinyl transferase superfamily protein [Streptomyces roseoverticillatus]